jgi:hypothetical protein
MSHHDAFVHHLHQPHPSSGWGPWVQEAPVDEADAGEGPGLLVSRAFWVGGGLSVLLWAGVTLLALQWL